MPRAPKQDRSHRGYNLGASNFNQYSHNLDSSSVTQQKPHIVNQDKPHRRHSIEASTFNLYYLQRSITIVLFSGRNQRWHSAAITASLPEIPLEHRHPQEDRRELTKALLTYTWKDASHPSKRHSAADLEGVDPLTIPLSPMRLNLSALVWWGSAIPTWSIQSGFESDDETTLSINEAIIKGPSVLTGFGKRGFVVDLSDTPPNTPPASGPIVPCLWNSDLDTRSDLNLEERQPKHGIIMPQQNIRSVRYPVGNPHLDFDEEDIHSGYQDMLDEEHNVQELFEDEELWSDLAEDPPWPDGEVNEFSADEHFSSDDLVTKLDTGEPVAEENFGSSSNAGCGQSTHSPQSVCHESDNIDTFSDSSSDSDSESDSDTNSSSGHNSDTESAITEPESEPESEFTLSPSGTFQLQNTVHAKFFRWQQFLQAEYALISALSYWLSHDISLLNIGPCLPVTSTINICGGTTSSCPICLHSCVEYYPQWSFLLPVLEESSSRIENGTCWVCRLRGMLQNGSWHGVESPNYEAEYEGVRFGTYNQDLNSIPEPPTQQLVTPDLEAKISEAEERLKRKQRRVASNYAPLR